MESAQLIYGGSPHRTHMAVIFTTTQQLVGGGRIQILAPEVYKLSCREDDGFNGLSLRRGIRSCDDAGTGLRLTLNETMAPGDWSFMIGGTNPAYTPNPNTFSLMLMDLQNNVIDARMQFEGQRIVQGLYVR